MQVLHPWGCPALACTADVGASRIYILQPFYDFRLIKNSVFQQRINTKGDQGPHSIPDRCRGAQFYDSAHNTLSIQVTMTGNDRENLSFRYGNPPAPCHRIASSQRQAHIFILYGKQQKKEEKCWNGNMPQHCMPSQPFYVWLCVGPGIPRRRRRDSCRVYSKFTFIE